MMPFGGDGGCFCLVLEVTRAGFRRQAGEASRFPSWLLGLPCFIRGGALGAWFIVSSESGVTAIIEDTQSAGKAGGKSSGASPRFGKRVARRRSPESWAVARKGRG